MVAESDLLANRVNDLVGQPLDFTWRSLRLCARPLFLGLCLLVVSCGCASLRSEYDGGVKRFTQSRSLSRATAMLEKGERSGAVRELTAITEAGSHAGITDEALFRLALLELHPSAERDGITHSLQLLKRLKKEFPSSSWTVQSGHLLELLAGVEELRRHNRSLKSQNQSLSGEVNELNRSIDQLKRLDQELEKKRR